MVNQIKENRLSHRMLMLIIGLMVVSTILFALGIGLERAGEANEPAGAHTEIEEENQEGNEAEAEHSENDEGGEEHEESSESAEVHEEENAVEEPHTETILGIDLESPIFVVGAIGTWAALAIGLWLFGRRVLVPIIIVAVGTALFDAVEVVTQINRSTTGIALLAALITILHIAIAALAFQVLVAQTSTQTNISSPQL